MKQVKSNFSIYKWWQLIRREELLNTEKNQSDFLALFIIDKRLPIEQESDLPKLDLYMKTLRDNWYTFNTF